MKTNETRIIAIDAEVVDLSKVDMRKAGLIINIWIHRYKIKVLNVAGPRASKDPMIYQATFELLEVLFTKEKGVDIPSSGNKTN